MNTLRNLRIRKGVTQKAIANELHIDVSTVTKWETGKSNPKIAKLPELAKIFGCSIDDLFGDDSKQNPVDGGSG